MDPDAFRHSLMASCAALEAASSEHTNSHCTAISTQLADFLTVIYSSDLASTQQADTTIINLCTCLDVCHRLHVSSAHSAVYLQIRLLPTSASGLGAILTAWAGLLYQLADLPRVDDDQISEALTTTFHALNAIAPQLCQWLFSSDCALQLHSFDDVTRIVPNSGRTFVQGSPQQRVLRLWFKLKLQQCRLFYDEQTYQWLKADPMFTLTEQMLLYEATKTESPAQYLKFIALDRRFDYAKKFMKMRFRGLDAAQYSNTQLARGVLAVINACHGVAEFAPWRRNTIMQHLILCAEKMAQTVRDELQFRRYRRAAASGVFAGGCAVDGTDAPEYIQEMQMNAQNMADRGAHEYEQVILGREMQQEAETGPLYAADNHMNSEDVDPDSYFGYSTGRSEYAPPWAAVFCEFARLASVHHLTVVHQHMMEKHGDLAVESLHELTNETENVTDSRTEHLHRIVELFYAARTRTGVFAAVLPLPSLDRTGTHSVKKANTASVSAPAASVSHNDHDGDSVTAADSDRATHAESDSVTPAATDTSVRECVSLMSLVRSLSKTDRDDSDFEHRSVQADDVALDVYLSKAERDYMNQQQQQHNQDAAAAGLNQDAVTLQQNYLAAPNIWSEFLGNGDAPMFESEGKVTIVHRAKKLILPMEIEPQRRPDIKLPAQPRRAITAAPVIIPRPATQHLLQQGNRAVSHHAARLVAEAKTLPTQPAQKPLKFTALKVQEKRKRLVKELENLSDNLPPPGAQMQMVGKKRMLITPLKPLEVTDDGFIEL
eukprot:TRINITY_DN1292_c0_g1_i1.p1 TRINITY_DN1292_c0_g1~~TRINITY_DN1292_c0_g1_i1.p1  ORF type:complete len:813 (-),score=179.19 TRINITY_DN1292_c0_g1_i1:233-2554(-)